MSSPVRALSVLVALTAACSGDASGAADAVIPPDANLSCVATDGGEAFPLRVGTIGDGGSFVELAEGQDVSLLWGFQGYLMLSIDLVAEVSLAGEANTCLQCISSLVSPTGAFDPSQLEAMQAFEPLGADMYSTHMFLVMAGSSTSYDGAEAELTIGCEGHGHSGEAEQSLGLVVPPR